MTKNDPFNFNIYWYDIWEQQSKQFFSLTNQYLQDYFSKDSFNIHDHMSQIQTWLNDLKEQWMNSLKKQDKNLYQDYAKLINQIFNYAVELLLKEWNNRNTTLKPIKNMIDLYELWLQCCQEACQRMQGTKTYQELYGDIMNSAMKFWKETAKHGH